MKRSLRTSRSLIMGRQLGYVQYRLGILYGVSLCTSESKVIVTNIGNWNLRPTCRMIIIANERDRIASSLKNPIIKVQQQSTPTHHSVLLVANNLFFLFLCNAFKILLFFLAAYRMRRLGNKKELSNQYLVITKRNYILFVKRRLFIQLVFSCCSLRNIEKYISVISDQNVHSMTL